MHRRILSIALAAGLLISLLLAACGGAAPSATPTAGAPLAGQTGPAVTQGVTLSTGGGQPASGGRLLTVKAVEGKVEIKFSGADGYSPARVDQTVAVGDEIRSGPNGRAVLVLDDGTRLVVSPNSAFRLKELSGTPQSPVTQFFLNVGQVFAVHKGELPNGASFQVETPGGVAAIRGSYVGVAFFDGSHLGAVMCLAGHCQYTPPNSNTPVDMTGSRGLRFDQNGEQGDEFGLNPIHLKLWASALEILNQADQGGASDQIQCVCSATTLTCDDGTTYDNFESCLPAGQMPASPLCACQGADLVCGDGSIYQNDADCANNGNQDMCSCDGVTSYCLDGSSTANDPSCNAANACQCDGATLVCGAQKSENDPTCVQEQADCQQVSCGDGVCDSSCGEDASSCSADCAASAEPTEQATAEPTEQPTAEPTEQPTAEPGADCSKAVCGDGSCDSACGEGATSCAADCGGSSAGGGADPCANASCGDGSCDGACGEDATSCAADCGTPLALLPASFAQTAPVCQAN